MFISLNPNLVKNGTTPDSNSTHENVATANSNGVWSWYTEPQAIVAYGYTFIGSISNSGQVKVTRVSTDGTTATFVLATLASGEIDDHNNASFLILPDNKLMATWSWHNDTSAAVYFRICSNVDDITNSASWTSMTTIPNTSGQMSTYSNPFMFSDNVVRIIMRERNTSTFALRISMKYCPLASIETPSSWTTTPIFTGSSTDDGRPYIRWAFNESNSDRVDIFCSNDHPDENTTGLYHCYIQLSGGSVKYYKSNGTEITASLPFRVESHMTEIEVDGVDHWVWDIKAKSANSIRVLGQRNKNNNSSYAEYNLHIWNGTSWTKQQLFDPAFTWSLYAGQPNYTGGICFFEGNWDKVFVSLPNANNGTDLSEWLIDTVNGTKRKIADITMNSASTMKSCRPSSPINWTYGHPRVVFWRGRYTTYLDYNTAVMTYK